MALSDLYRPSLGLLTDLYQLTMAYGYWRLGRAEREAVFHLSFRRQPFEGGFTVACGLATAIDWLDSLRFEADDLAYLATLRGHDDQPLFDPAFLDYLADLRWRCDVDAVEEGTVVFPHEPLLRVRGPILQAQIAETALLNLINFQSLIATKACRICQAAAGEPVLEFGLRRAHGIDGAITASRAAYIGGCTHTSNVLAGKLHGIPVRGTHAHSWVMSFDDELEAFDAYAAAMPNNCVFLVDTYDTIDGVRAAIEAGHRLRARGAKLLGIRLDSGDLAYLSIEARRMLDEAGFHDATIVASNDLDEHVITSLKQQGATIGVWGVGTRLSTAFDQPALGGVYKLAAIRNAEGEWEHRVKLSEQAIKITTPGMLQVRRYHRNGEYVADMVLDELQPGTPMSMIVDPADATRRRPLDDADGYESLLVPVHRRGERVYDVPSAHQARARVQEQLAKFHAGVKRFVNPHGYPVGLEAGLHDHRTELVLRQRGVSA